MDIAIRSRNVELSEALKSTVEDKVNRLSRFLDGMERAEINFSEERNPRISDREVCEVTMVGRGRIVRAHAAASDPYGAVDRVIDKLEHRMEKLKGKRVPKSARSASGRHGSVEFSAEAGETPAAADEADDVDGLVNPGPLGRNRIVKTKQFAMKPMTPEEAVLQMDLLGHQFFFFANSDTGAPAVVYQRRDGFVGLIDGR